MIKIINSYYLRFRTEKDHEIVFSNFYNESKVAAILRKEKDHHILFHDMLLMIKTIGLNLCLFSLILQSVEIYIVKLLLSL